MKEQPTLTTERLILRPFSLSDAKEAQRLIGDYAVADTLLNVPYPFEDGMAEEWISKRQGYFEEGKGVSFAITHCEKGFLLGSISLENISQTHENAEMGYWIGKFYWRTGYCTEAAQAVVKYGFEKLDLNRIYAMHMTRNPRSGSQWQAHSGRSQRDFILVGRETGGSG